MKRVAFAVLLVLAVLGLTVAPTSAQTQPFFGQTAPRPGMMVTVPQPPTPPPTIVGRVKLDGYGDVVEPEVQVLALDFDYYTGEFAPRSGPPAAIIRACYDASGKLNPGVGLGCVARDGQFQTSQKLARGRYLVRAFAKNAWDEWTVSRDIEYTGDRYDVGYVWMYPFELNVKTKMVWVDYNVIRAIVTVGNKSYYSLPIDVTFTPEDSSWTKPSSEGYQNRYEDVYIPGGSSQRLDFWAVTSEWSPKSNANVCGRVEVKYAYDSSWVYAQERVCVPAASPFPAPEKGYEH